MIMHDGAVGVDILQLEGCKLHRAHSQSRCLRHTIGREGQAVHRPCVGILQLVEGVPGQALIDHNVVARPSGGKQAPVRVPCQATARM